MDPKYIIYGLVDPRTSQIRYVGRSSSGLRRPLSHYQNHNDRKTLPLNNWIKGLKLLNLKYGIAIMEVLQSSDGLNNAECRHIANVKASGASLLNLTDGGGGRTGATISDEQKRKLSNTLKHRRPSDACFEARRQSMIGKPLSLHVRTAISRSHGGKSIIDQNGFIHPTVEGAARQLGLNASCIFKVLSGKQKQTHGYTFMRLES